MRRYSLRDALAEPSRGAREGAVQELGAVTQSFLVDAVPDKRLLFHRARFLPGFDNRLFATRRPARRVRRVHPPEFLETEEWGLGRADPA